MFDTFSDNSGKLMSQYLAQFMGIPEPLDAWIAFAAQTAIEDGGGTSFGAQTNNPLNLRPIPGGWYGQTGVSSGNFAEFDSLADGCKSCAANYFNGSSYAGVRSAFASGNPVDLAKAIEASPWDEGHYSNGELSNLVSSHWSKGGAEVDVLQDFRNCFITQATRWPTPDEESHWQSSGDSPYHWVQVNAPNPARDEAVSNAKTQQQKVDQIATQEAVRQAVEPLQTQLTALQNQPPTTITKTVVKEVQVPLSLGTYDASSLVKELVDRFLAFFKGANGSK